MSKDLSHWLIVVPARLKSQRLTRKPLADLGGLPLVVRVAKNLAPLTSRGASLIVATDADEIMTACREHSVPAIMTRVDHESGTDRCQEAARGSKQQFILNVQGDEPFVDTNDLVALMAAMEQHGDADIGTLVFESGDAKLATDPNVVKAVRRLDGYALYFSRSLLPYDRDGAARAHAPAKVWQHLGVYAFRRERLEAFVRLPPSHLERTEKLEQLRALDNGWRIYLQPAKSCSRSIDTPDDLEAARKKLKGTKA